MNKKEFFDKLIALQNSDRYEAFRAEERAVTCFLKFGESALAVGAIRDFINPDFAWHFRALKEALAMQSLTQGDPEKCRIYIAKYGGCLCSDHWIEAIAAIGVKISKKRGRKSGRVISSKIRDSTTADVAFYVGLKVEGGNTATQEIELAASELGMSPAAVGKIYWTSLRSK